MASYTELSASYLSNLNPFKGQNKLKAALFTTWFPTGHTPIPAGRNLTSDLLSGYLDSPIIYSIINKIASTASNVPMRLYDQDDEAVESHWVLDLIDKPNEDTTFDELLFSYYVYYLAIGNSYLYSPKLEGGKTIELWTMPSDRTEVIAGPSFNQPIEGYRLLDGNQEVTFEKPSVMHGKMFNPRYIDGRFFYGLSPISVAREIIYAMNAGDRAMANSFTNMGPPYIISSQMPEGLTQSQQEMLEKTYQKKYGGMQKDGSFSRKPMLTGTPVKVERMGDSAGDLKLIDSSQHGLRVLCNVYGVPSQLFNDTEGTTFSNMESAMKQFYEYTIKPLNKGFAEKLTAFLGLDKGMKLRFDYEGIEVLQDAFLKEAQALETSWFLTVNERRKMLGLNEIDDPLLDEIYIPGNYTALENTQGQPEQLQKEFLTKPSVNGKAKAKADALKN